MYQSIIQRKSMKFIIYLTVLMLGFTSIAMALDVSPDGPKIVNLAEDATSVIVGNPAHATVVMDNPRMLIVNAGRPGMTNLTVLGRNGKVIMNEHIIVNGAAPGYVRIKNACINGGDSCQPTSMYYCEPGQMCHNVMVNEPSVSGGGGGAAPAINDAGILDAGSAPTPMEQGLEG